ncbi:hypothetical protein Agabi119p4_2694 [Agaricus bisporus var. burnettii]|uniref:Uncharacterized protein n=1 Tax=Agaricus bisporus var. burnettii TaxID=192524 RepID=A0A8H7KKJ5_AGABI|nr:hypothetical protein Agabi119p4_2694 [Agaricus bisporus var. burnettii]
MALPFVRNLYNPYWHYMPGSISSPPVPAKPTASPTTLDLDSLSPSTISDLMATPEWSTPLSPVSAPQASPKSKLLGGGKRSLLFGPLGFFTSGYMLGLFLMASPFVFHHFLTFFLIQCRHSFCTDYITPSRLSRRHAARRGRLLRNHTLNFLPDPPHPDAHRRKAFCLCISWMREAALSLGQTHPPFPNPQGGS